MLTFLREVLEPAQAGSPDNTRQLTYFRAELKVPFQEYLQLHHILRHAVRPWHVIATHQELDSDGNWTFVPLGGNLEIGEVPSNVAEAIGRALDQFADAGTNVAYRLE